MNSSRVIGPRFTTDPTTPSFELGRQMFGDKLEEDPDVGVTFMTRRATMKASQRRAGKPARKKKEAPVPA